MELGNTHPMVSGWAGEAKYQALLAVAEATHAQRELSRVLEELARALAGLVSIDMIGVVTHEPDVVRARAMYVRSDPRRPGESQEDYVARTTQAGGARERSWPHNPVARRAMEEERRTVVLTGISGDARFDGTGMKTMGAETAVLLPLTMGHEFVAAMIIARVNPEAFTPDEVAILEDVARPVATAVANALAWEENQNLRARLEDENLALREEIVSNTGAGGIIGASAGLREVLERVSRVAPTESTVLILGETGTGKELLARAIHAGSPRAKRAMVKVNCAALPEGLVASELFGHERGAFTGALERRKGRFELAAGGTIFLDEVGELPPPMQVALLRILQEHEFERVGGHETLRADVRVVAATNRNLEDATHEGTFRTDLFFRLNVFPIHVPPLRERAEDIPLLAEYWASHYGRYLGKPIRRIDAGAMKALCAYQWPGNIRELQNVIERAVILARGSALGVAELELPKAAPRREAAVATPAVAPAGADDEREQIEQALAASKGRVYGLDGAAAALGIPPSTLESRIRRLGIDKLDYRRRPSR